MPEEPQGIVLASASPRRSELLGQVGVRCQVIPSNTDEVLLAKETAEAHVVRLSRGKALEVARRHAVAGRWFIGSDTIVVLDGTILGKPADAAAARGMLKSLSGRSHRVISGYAVHDRVGGRTISAAVGSFMIPRIEGSYTNVVGLPLCEVIAALEELGAIELFDE